MGGIPTPSPPFEMERAKDTAGNQQSAEQEKDDHRLMPNVGKCIGDCINPTMSGAECGEVDEEKISPVLPEDHEGCDRTQQIKQDGRPGVTKAGRCGQELASRIARGAKP